MYFPFSGLEYSPVIIVLWGILVGYVFSTVGAAGAILTMIGQTTIFKIDQALIKTFIGQGMEEVAASKAAAGSVKVHQLMAVMLAPFIAVPKYLKERRIAIPLALCVGGGAILGALIGPAIPMTMAQYKFWFGVVVFLIGLRLVYETTPRFLAGKQKLAALNKSFENKVVELRKTGNWEELAEAGYKLNKFTIGEMSFTFWGEEFVISPIVAAIGGALIAIIASMFGLGGGFLFVPYLSSIFMLPMFIVSSTSITIVFITSLTGAFGYIARGAIIDWLFIGVLLVGVAIGSYIGPLTQKYYKEKYLRWLIAAILIFYGARFAGIWAALGWNV